MSTSSSKTAAPAASVGNGGETHQSISSDKSNPSAAKAQGDILTTNQGVHIVDNQNSLKSGVNGPTLLEDFVLREKIFHFDHERIPERVVHARGSGAHGFFELYDSLANLTSADLFQRAGEKTPVFVRFSTVVGGAGSVDTPRDVRGFATKFYTKAGVFDLVGNNIPVFFIQDAMKFPDLVHSVKMEAVSGFPQAASAHTTFWDFIGLMPESTHMIMWAMSDRTLPRSYRMMQGFGIHTFRLVNAKGASTFVKFHWKPMQGVQSTTWDEAMKLAGADPDFHRRDLYEAIERGDYPEYELGLQTFDEAFAAKLPFDVLDATKIIPEELLAVRPIGRMVLNRWPDNFFAETEQVAFCPANVVPGIDFTNDPLLQGRLFSYLDTQLKRLGSPNFHQLPINAPQCPVMNFQRDGHMRMIQPKGRANYEPNSLAEQHEGKRVEDAGPRECPSTGFKSYAGVQQPNSSQHDCHLRVRAELFADHYSQARLFYRSLDPVEQLHMINAFVFELSKVEFGRVRERVVANIGNVDATLAQRVAQGLGMKTVPAPSPMAREPRDDQTRSPAVRIVRGPLEVHTLKGRTVALLVHAHSDAALVKSVRDAAKAADATPLIVAVRLGDVALSDGSSLGVDRQLASFPSMFADAICVILSADATKQLCKDNNAVQFVALAHQHLKAIGFTEACTPLLSKAGVDDLDEGFVMLDKKHVKDFIDAGGRRFWTREESKLVE